MSFNAATYFYFSIQARLNTWELFIAHIHFTRAIVPPRGLRCRDLFLFFFTGTLNTWELFIALIHFMRAIVPPRGIRCRDLFLFLSYVPDMEHWPNKLI